MREWLFGDGEVAELELPRPEVFQTFRLDEELVEEAEPRCRLACGVSSAGRGGEVEDLEKLGTGSESTMLGVRRALLHRRTAREYVG